MKHYRSTIEVRTKVKSGRGVLNLNTHLAEAVEKAGIRNGFLVIRSLHTTAGIVGQEDEDGILRHDLPNLLNRLIPKSAQFRHDNFEKRQPRVGPDERVNGKAHLECMLIAHPSLILDIHDYKMDLGTWLSILFIDFDPRNRKSRRVAITILGE